MVFALLWWWRPALIAERANMLWLRNSFSMRISYIQSAVLHLPRGFLRTLTSCITALGIALGPVAIGSWTPSAMKRTFWFIVGCTGLTGLQMLLGGELELPLALGETWSLNQLGLSQLLFRTSYSASTLSTWVPKVSECVAILMFAMAASTIGQGQWKSGAKLQMVVLVPQVFLMAVLYLWGDRYSMILLPSLVGLVLMNCRAVNIRCAAIVVAVFAVISLVGVRDDFEFNRALALGIKFLQDKNIPLQEASAGYVYNGWLQYAHPENANKDEKGYVQVPRVNVNDSDSGVRYRVTNTEQDGWTVLDKIPYSQWMGAGGFVYVSKAIGPIPPS
jgi:hypothetical protein